MNEKKTARCPHCNSLVIIRPAEAGGCHRSWHDCLFAPASLTVLARTNGGKLYGGRGVKHQRQLMRHR